MRHLPILLLLAIFDCSREEKIRPSTYPELEGRYNYVKDEKHYWRFNHTDIAQFDLGVDKLGFVNMQWYVEDTVLYMRLYDADESWRGFPFNLSGDTLRISTNVYLKTQ